MDAFAYSPEFRQIIIQLHRGKESWPFYEAYLAAHLGGPGSRLISYKNGLCREMEHHCGPLQNKRVLDFGCGTGATTAALAYYSNQVCAFDTNPESIRICQRRLEEHGFDGKVRLFCDSDLDRLVSAMGQFDVILVNGVIEHIPLSRRGLRARILCSLFGMLNRPGYLVINDTPNRLYPIDLHSTGLWWIPWTRGGSNWAYRRAVKKGRHADAPTSSDGPIGLEEVGAWGATYWEITRPLKGERFVCVNTLPGHDRQFSYTSAGGWKRRLFESALYYLAVKPLKLPMTAFFPFISYMVLRKD